MSIKVSVPPYLIFFFFLLFKCLSLNISVRNSHFLPMHSVEFTDAAVMKTIHFPQGMPFQFTLFISLAVTDILLSGWEHFQVV